MPSHRGARAKKPARGGFHKPFAERIADEIVHEGAVAEADFGFRRMYVDVDFFGVAFEEEERERIAAAGIRL